MRSTNIIYIGEPNDLNATEVVALLDRQAKDDPEAKLAVHTSPRDPQGALEWSVHVTSPRGRRTLAVSQRRPCGAIQIK